MAILGAQLVITLVMVSLIQKLNPYYSFAKWLLCSTGLIRYLHPTDKELKELAGVPKIKPGKQKSYSKDQKQEKSDTFHVPRNLDLHLETTEVCSTEVVYLRYFTEYKWLLDFSLFAGIVYIISETYTYFFPINGEVNLSMVWCALVVFFSFKLLFSLTVLYFQSEESIGERSMVIVAFLVYLLVAMIVLIIDESILETGLETAYASFNNSALKFLNDQGLSSSGPASKIVVKFIIALMCGLLGSLFTFPGLRMARMHWDSLRYCENNKFKQLLLNISFVLPFILVIMWIRPISRDYLTVRIFNGRDKPLLEPHVFETSRLLIVLFVVILRFSLLPIYLQSYLNIAYDKVQEMKKEAGRITNIELQKKVSSIFYYLCVVTLQFAAPLILCLYLTLMYKSLGGFSWTGLYQDSLLQNQCSAEDHMEQQIKEFEEIAQFASVTPTEEPVGDNFDFIQSAQGIHESLTSLKNVFTEDVYKGFLGFATWWSYFTLFATSSLGIVYQSYFTNS